MPDLTLLLARIDPGAPLAQRHLWLIDLLDWVRGNCVSAEDSVQRLCTFLDQVQTRPELERKLQLWWQVLSDAVDPSTLLADYGFASSNAFVSEFGHRLRLKLLPGTPETTDAAELFSLVLPTAFDARWIALLDPPTLERLAALMVSPAPLTDGGISPWERELLEAVTYCIGQIRAIGFSPELRTRMSEPTRESQPFHALAADGELVCSAFARAVEPGLDAERQALALVALEQAVQQLKERLEACRMAATSVYSHLEAHGISVTLVFRLRQLRERVLRVRDLLNCLLSPKPMASTAAFIGKMVLIGQERGSLRALVSASASMLAAKVAERSAETGEQYITRNRAEYWQMLRQAAGGGLATAGTTLLKFALGGLGLSAFWGGFWVGALYGASFVLMQLMHWTLATKQPGMTAPAMAIKLRDLSREGAVEEFITEVAHLVRSQVAAVLGNVGLVAPTVLLLCAVLQWLSGRPLLDAGERAHVLSSLHLLGPGTLLFAAFTGILLFASSLIAGWAENWFVLHRLDSAIRYNPRITRRLGAQRADRWAGFMRRHVSSFASNMSLGFMLGLVPPVLGFFGLALEARHVTLSMGQLSAAAASEGWTILGQGAFWWCLAAIPLIGVLNLAVSFGLAFRLAVVAQNLGVVDRGRIRTALWQRVRSHPMSFLVPERDRPQNASASS
jgi:site-specific recombinase